MQEIVEVLAERGSESLLTVFREDRSNVRREWPQSFAFFLAGAAAALRPCCVIFQSIPVLCQNSAQLASTKEPCLSKSNSNSSTRTGYAAAANI